MIRRTIGGLALIMAGTLAAADEPVDKIPFRMDRVKKMLGSYGRPSLHYAWDITENWMLPAFRSNPAMLDMFRDRDRKPYRQLEPWAGEFAGKYLTSAVQIIRYSGGEVLELELKGIALDPNGFVPELISLQAENGYLGPWPKDFQLTGKAPNAGGQTTWDAWGHYHLMLGLLMWYEEKEDQAALTAARKIGDLLCNKFLGKKSPRLVDTGSTEMNLAPAHSLCLLYRVTKEPKYLALAKQIVDIEFAAKDAKGKPLAGDWLNEGLAGKEFFTGPKPRWESLHPMMAMSELYHITGNESYRKAFENLWWSIVKLDRHNNGGFSSGEQAQGNPYHPGAIETCCTVAWLAMSVEMLRTTGSSIVADELELTTLNSGLGLWSPSGRWATYNTPMDGVRKASAHDIVFQSREGSPELNCCSVNAARAIGMISDWGLMTDSEGLVVNLYGGGASIGAQLRTGKWAGFYMDTRYPRDSKVKLTFDVRPEDEFTIKFRIPYWSKKTRVSLNGKAVENVVAGSYLPLRKKWTEGDVVEIDFDFSPHFWVGERECKGKTSVYRGPLLLTFDRRFNDLDSLDGLTLRAQDFPGSAVDWKGPRDPILLLELPASNGAKVRLCDFASAGQGGSPYRSWLPIEGAKPTPFSRENPLRSGPMK
jgi:uncharacterized protein